MGRYSQRLPERGRIGIFNRSFERLDLTYPKVDDAKLKALAAARKALAAERE
jgi:polyphosphate kinase 2 (PPK2 family)